MIFAKLTSLNYLLVSQTFLQRVNVCSTEVRWWMRAGWLLSKLLLYRVIFKPRIFAELGRAPSEIFICPFKLMRIAHRPKVDLFCISWLTENFWAEESFETQRTFSHGQKSIRFLRTPLTEVSSWVTHSHTHRHQLQVSPFPAAPKCAIL